MESKWLRFDKKPSQREEMKTSAHYVINKGSECIIGEVRWYPAFRKYAFFAKSHTVYDSECMTDIVRFINKLMLERKVEKQNAKEVWSQ